MVDIFVQSGADKPRPTNLILTEEPKSRVSAEQIMAPMADMAKIVGHMGEVVEQASMPLQRAAGAQAVTLDENGQPQVTLRPEITAGDKAYNAAALQGAMAKGTLANSEALVRIREESKGDPTTFKTMAEAYTARVGGSDSIIGPHLKAQAEEQAGQHFTDLLSQRVKANLANDKTAIESNISVQKNSLVALAAAGAAGTPEYDAALQKVADGYEQLTRNPTFGYPRERADSEVAELKSNLAAQGVIATVDSTFNKSGRAEAQKILGDRILRDPSLNLSESERSRLYNTGLARLSYLTGENKAQVDAHKQVVTSVTDGLHKYAPAAFDAVEGTIARARELGDTESVLKLEAARTQAISTRGMASGTDEQRLQSMTSGGPTVRAGSAAVDQAISAAAQKHGVDVNLLNRIAHIESRFDPNADNGVAQGLFQFVPSTWKQYGQGANVRDPNANADAAARLLVANRDQLRTSLGREPTNGELYLAHQQGAGGAAALLKNPDAPATTVVGRKAVTMNGGTLDMTAGQFAQLWIEKVEGPGGGAARSPPGGVSTAQAKINPFLASEAIRFQLNDERGMVKTASNVADSMISGIDKGALPSAENLGAVLQVHAQFPGKLDEKVSQLAAKLAGHDAAQADLGLPSGQGAALAAQAKVAASGGSIFAQHFAEARQAAYDRGVAALKDEPFLEAHRRRWIASPPPPLDLSSPEAFAQTLHWRGDLAGAIASHTGNEQGALTPAEVGQVKNLATNGDQKTKMAIIQGIAGLPDPVRNATLAQIGSQPDGALFALAGGMAKVAPEIAASIVQGANAIKTDERYVPNKGANKQAFEQRLDEALPGAAFTKAARMDPAGPMVAMNQGITARYAYLSAQANDLSGNVDTSRLRQAADDVTGGILRHNGAPIIAPVRGMPQRDFDGVISGLTDKDLPSVTTGNGAPITADYLRANAKLHSYGDGRYLVQVNADDKNPQYAMQRGANPPVFVLDLRGRKPVPVAVTAYDPMPGFMSP